MELTAFAFEIKDGVAHITLNQPERGNPFDAAFAEEFDWLATECTVRPEVRAVLIDAKGRFFSVGGDLNALSQQPRGSGALRLRRDLQSAHGHLALRAHERARRAAVHGLAAGGVGRAGRRRRFRARFAQRQVLRGLRRHRHHQRQRRHLLPAAPHGLAPRRAVLHAQRDAERRGGRGERAHQQVVAARRARRRGAGARARASPRGRRWPSAKPRTCCCRARPKASKANSRTRRARWRA